MLRNIIFSLHLCYVKLISDNVTANDDVTGMMTSSLIYRIDYNL